MNKLRSKYIYQLEGKILGIRTRRAPLGSANYGKLFYQLIVDIEESSNQTKKIQVFQNRLANSVIWEEVKQGDCKHKSYSFDCRNVKGNYHLINWKELINHD